MIAKTGAGQGLNHLVYSLSPSGVGEGRRGGGQWCVTESVGNQGIGRALMDLFSFFFATSLHPEPFSWCVILFSGITLAHLARGVW